MLIHTDLHDILPEHNGNRYIIAFLDDFSRKILYYEEIANKKSVTAAAALERCIRSVQPESINTLMSDNGGEFVGHEF